MDYKTEIERIEKQRKYIKENKDKIEQSILGKTENEAMEILNSHGLNGRVIRKNGNHLMATADMRIDRLNLELDKGIDGYYVVTDMSWC